MAHGAVVRLMRVSDSAKEGVFTCHIPRCNNSLMSVGVYYPERGGGRGGEQGDRGEARDGE